VQSTKKIIEKNLEQFIADGRELVEKKLDELVPSQEMEPARLHEAIRWSLFAGGKRFRPVLMLAVGKTFACKPEEQLRAAAAIEMIHTYSLIHDDLPAMDDDDLRRGRETCHKKFDEATAILAGDVLQVLAFQTISEDETLSSDVRMRLISEISRAAGTPAGMVAGQFLDLAAESKEINGEQLENIHRNKTGALIRVAACSGAIIAGAGDAEIEAISDYASSLGLLFQITDDLLDVTAPAEALGKTPGKDAQAAKATYVSLYGIERTREMAQNVHARACEKLDLLQGDAGLLREIADYVLHREN
jgi:geranylgeranyl diphosphate synthase type II